MVHAHAHRDHVANLHARSPDNDVTVVYVTLSADFDGPIGGYVTMSQTSSDTSDKATAGLGAPIQQTRSSSKEETTTIQTSEKTKVEAAATATKDSDRQSTTTQKAEQTTHASETAITEQVHTSTAQTTFQTSSSSSTSAITGLEDAAVTASSTSVPAASASPTAMPASQGLTGGAKAGIAIGVIVAVGAIAVFILLWLRKKKQGQHIQEVEPENEKYVRQDDIAPPPPPKPESVTSPSPPQLNIRPVTQFAPFASDFASNSGAAGLSVGGSLAPVAESAVVSRSLTDHPSPPQTPNSSSHGSDPFGDPVNPFSNGAEAPSPLASSTALSIASAPVPQATEEAASTPEETAATAETEQISPVVSAAESEPVAEDAIVTGVAAAAAVVGVAAVATSTSKTQEKQLPVSPEDSETGPQAISQEAVLDGTPTATTPSTLVAAPVAAPGPRPPPSGPAPPPPGNVHRVQMDFNPSMEDELELHFGQLVRLLHEYDDGWALCTRLDRSQQGVVPRSCLSSRPLKPRPPPGPGARGPPMAAPNRPMPPRPTTPSSSFNPPLPRPQSPARPMSPGQPSYAGPGPMPLRLPNQRPMSPAQGPPAPRSFSPGPGPRPMAPRSMSPGPYGLPGMQKPSMPASQRSRSNSTGAAMGPNPRQGGFPGPSPLGGPMMPPVSTIPRATPTVVESPISETGNREW